MNVIAHLADSTVTAPTVDSSALVDKIKTVLGGVFSIDNLIPVIVGALGITAGFFIFWFAYRFIKGKASGALKKGKL